MSTVTPPTGIGRFLRTFGGHRGPVVATAAVGAAAAAAGVGLIATAAVLISRSALLHSTAGLALTIVGVRFFATSRVVLRYAERMVGHLGTFRLLTRIRTRFFAAVIPIAPRGLIDRRTGELLGSILDDVDTMQELYLRVLVPPIVGVITVATAAGVLIGTDAPSAAVLLTGLLLFVATVPPLTRRRSHRATTTIDRATVTSRAAILESIEAARELVMFDATSAAVGEVVGLDRRAESARGTLAVTRGWSDAAIAVTGPAIAMVALALGIGGLRRGTVDGQVLALLPLVALVAAEVLPMVSAWSEARDRAAAAAGRLLHLVDRGDAAAARIPTHRREPASALAIEARHLTVRADDGGPILADVSISIPMGATVAIIGSSGAGKSTLIDVLLGLADHDGELRIAGAEGAIAAVRQQDHIFDTTVRDNLALADPEADTDQLQRMLARTGLTGFIDALPEGLDTRTGPDGIHLSGGERQRLLIARALLADRSILILDEAFEHLDPHRRTEVLRSVLDQRRGRTTVLVTHDEALISRADLCIELRGGRSTIRA